MIAAFFARSVGMKIVAWLALGTVVALPLVGWGAYKIGAHVERKTRDAWWKETIATKSSGVREQIAAGDAAAELTDEQVIEALEGDDHALAEKEKELATLRETARRTATLPSKDPQPDACPVIPGHCLLP